MMGDVTRASILGVLGIEQWVLKEVVCQPTSQASATLSVLLVLFKPAKAQHKKVMALLENILGFLELKREVCDILYVVQGQESVGFPFNIRPQTVIGFGQHIFSACHVPTECQSIETLDLVEVLAEPSLKKRILMDIYELKNNIAHHRSFA